MQSLDDRVLADLVLERGFATKEQMDACIQELSQATEEPGKVPPSLAVILLTKGMINEAKLYELAQLHRARTMNPSDAKTPTPRVQMSPLRTDPPTTNEAPPRAQDPRKSTGHGVPAAKDSTKSTGHELKAATLRTTGHELRASPLKPQDPLRSTGHEIRALPGAKDPRKSTGHEVKALPAGKKPGPPKGPVPRKAAAALSPEEMKLATQQTYVERKGGKSDGELPPEAAEAAQYEDYCFKDFVLTQELGRGGMGVVWKAWQRTLKRWVAIKFLEDEQRDELDRFIREAQSVAALSHPNITAMYELGKYEENYYIVMEYVDGQQLQDVLGKLPVQAAVKIFHACALALDHAHRHNIIHRDIKPQNIMITKAGKPYLMDFGLAKKRKAESHETVAGMILGTPAFMAPEQAEGKFQRIDKRSDVYSLCATLYAVLAGRPPFEGHAVMDTLYKVVHGELRPLRKDNPNVPPEIEAVVHRGMAKLPAERYPNAREMAADLQRWLDGEPVSALPLTGMRKVKHAAKKNRGLLVAAICAAALVLGAVLFFLSRTPPPEDAPRSDGPPKKPEVRPPPKDQTERVRKEFADAEETLRTPGARWGTLVERAEKCIATATEALAANPDQPELHVLRGRALALLDRRDEAEAAFKRAGDSPSAHLQLGLLRLAESEEKAVEPLRRCAESSRDERESRFARTLVAYLEGRTGEAIDAATALAKSGERAEYYWLRGRANEKAQNLEAALTDYGEARRLEPNRGLHALAAADVAQTLRRYDQAEATLRNYLEFRREDDDALIRLARVKALQKDSAAAVEIANRVVELKPEKIRHLGERALIHLTLRQYKPAIADANAYLSKEQSAAVLNTRGTAYGMLQDYTSARADYLAAIQLNPDYVMAHVNLAMLSQFTGHREEAPRHIDNALRCRTITADEYSGIAQACNQYALDKKTLTVCDRADALNPVREIASDIAVRRFEALTYLKEWDRALAEARRILEKLGGDESGYSNNLGFIEYQRGNNEKALELYTKAVTLNPKLAVAYANRAACYFKLKRWKEAVDDYKQAISLNASYAQTLGQSLRKAEENLRNEGE